MANHSPARSHTFPLTNRTHALAHPQAPLHLLRAHVASTPVSPPLSICSSTCTTPSLAEAASPPIRRAALPRILTTSLTSSPTSTLAPALPDPTPTAPMPKSRPLRKSTLSVFAGASGITIIGGTITNAGGNVFRRGGTFTSYRDAADGKKIQEDEDPENSSDDDMEVSAFENVTGLTALGAVVVNTGGDVLSGMDGPSLKDRGYNAHTHMFTGAKDVVLDNVEVGNAAGNVYVGTDDPVGLTDVRSVPEI